MAVTVPNTKPAHADLREKRMEANSACMEVAQATTLKKLAMHLGRENRTKHFFAASSTE